jgi:hypothetical protein
VSQRAITSERLTITSTSATGSGQSPESWPLGLFHDDPDQIAAVGQPDRTEVPGYGDMEIKAPLAHDTPELPI